MHYFDFPSKMHKVLKLTFCESSEKCHLSGSIQKRTWVVVGGGKDGDKFELQNRKQP